MSNAPITDALCESVCSTKMPHHGIEVWPVFLGDFDHFSSRGYHQVRVNLWGWPAVVMEWIMRRRWIIRHCEPDKLIK